jgi:hypothetical protein
VSYRVRRDLGYQPWGVTNPWVFANYGQPQRHRGYVSPLVYQTREPFLRSHYLGQTVTTSSLDEDQRRAMRMEAMGLVGLALSGAYLVIVLSQTKKMSSNRRRRRSR